MSLFPFMENENEDSVNVAQEQAIPREYEIDFKNNKLTGRIVSGSDAIKMWILKVLKSERYKHLIYSWDYGIELEELISKPYDRGYIESEIARNIEEALKINTCIKGIESFSSTFAGSTLTCEFVVITDFGEVNIHEQYTNI